MQLTTALLKNTVSKLNYQWYNDRPNIIGIRTSMQVPDVFNDFLCVAWTQSEKMPATLSVKQQQQWLNMWGYRDSKNRSLTEDGVPGANTEFALNAYRQSVEQERMNTYVITTEPGIYYQKQPMSPKGCAVIKPGQWTNAYSIGTHVKPDHAALVQTGNITVYRDNDKDGIAEATSAEESGLFGCNIHGAVRNTKTNIIGMWSAGCQVFTNWSDKEEFIGLCANYKTKTNNRFTYTLVDEKDLQA